MYKYNTSLHLLSPDLIITMSQPKKSALVTGASSGIGKALAKELHARGFKVFAAARNVARMEDLVDLGIYTLRLDVSSLESVIEVKDKISQLTGGNLDYLFNNAGQSCGFPAMEVSDEQILQCYQVNVFGVMRMSREFLPLLVNSKGKIIITGSISAHGPFPWGSVYASSKMAIEHYASILRVELKPFDVDVSVVVTGGVATEIEETRPISENSFFNTPEGLLTLQERRSMSANSKPMSPETYAKNVCNDVIKSSTIRFDFWRGTYASRFWFFSTFIPRSILEHALMIRFKVYDFIRITKQKQLKKSN